MAAVTAHSPVPALLKQFITQPQQTVEFRMLTVITSMDWYTLFCSAAC